MKNNLKIEILKLLLEYDRPLSINEIAIKLNKNVNDIKKVLNELKKLGYVEE